MDLKYVTIRSIIYAYSVCTLTPTDLAHVTKIKMRIKRQVGALPTSVILH